MKCRLLAILSALSLLLCIATCALWARSFLQCDRIARFYATGFFELESSHGSLAIHSFSDGIESLGTRTPGWEMRSNREVPIWQSQPDFNDWRFLGFMAGGCWRLDSAPENWLVAPDYSIELALAVIPFFNFRVPRKARQRVASGLCLACGYDLRATIHRCPECGTAPQPMGEV